MAPEKVCPVLVSVSNRSFISNISVLHLKIYFVFDHPCCPWGSRHHVTTLAAAQKGGWVREGGYFYVRHPVPLAGFHGGSDYGLLTYEAV
jgi:hypothetical protein